MKSSRAIDPTYAIVVLVLAVILNGACGGDDAAPPEAGSECPAHPEEWIEADAPAWPSEEAGDLVPAFEGVCATPAAPSMYGLLNEAIGFSSSVEASALGILHLGDEAVATFSVVRAREGTPGLDQDVIDNAVAMTKAGDLELGWARGGDHVTVYWLDDRDFVTLAAEASDALEEAASAWLRADGIDARVSRPAEIPDIIEIGRPLDAGAPLDELPNGYSALEMNPIAFAGSDFADAVGIFEDQGIEAMGAAIVLSDGAAVATIVGVDGEPEEIGTRPSDIAAEASFGGDAVAGFVVDEKDILIVGADEDLVSGFAEAWESNISVQGSD